MNLDRNMFFDTMLSMALNDSPKAIGLGYNRSFQRFYRLFSPRKFIFLILFSLLGLTCFAQSVTRDLGSMMVSFKIGTYIPLFMQNLAGKMYPTQIGIPESSSSVHQVPIGGVLEFNYAFYLDPHWRVGVDTLFSLSQDINGHPLFMVPLSFRTAYEFRFGQFTMPLFLDTGMMFIIYNSTSTMYSYTPLLRPGISFNWQYSSQWSIGLSLSYWWVPEIRPHQTTMANFVDVLMNISYYF